MIKYIELKTGYSDNGPAWIANVNLSKSGNTIYFNGMALKSIGGAGIQGNYLDSATRDEYWITGIKKSGSNRHSSGTGKIQVEQAAVSEFLELIGATELDANQFKICSNFKPTTGKQFYHIENEKLL